MSKKLMNYVNGAWIESTATEYQNVINPATAEVLSRVPLSPAKDVDSVVQAASTAFDAWRRTPATTRIQYLFKLKDFMEVRFEDFARTIVLENGKTIQEARGEMRRAIENVETACGIPVLMQGYLNEDIASGIDEMMIRQPLGVVAIIAPFNFPGMIPFWFLPYALATGNTVIIKPSERCPMTMHLAVEIMEQLDLPDGVVNLVNGGPDAVNALLDHPTVKAISFVGSTPVARHVYSRGAASGKRVQAQGGAKNPLVLMPDADVEMTTRIVTDSVFGNAGQRCLAAANIIMVGAAQGIFIPALQEAAVERVVGYGLDENTQMGPVITPQSKERITGLIQKGIQEGADLVVDGRQAAIAGYEQGNYLLPSILKNVSPKSEIARTEIFGPVMSVMHAETLGEALQTVNGGAYGNMACIFTNSGGAARRFRNEAMAGNIGVNIGVAAPMAFFPFSGWKDSFFGTLHGQGQHAVEFYTQTKVVIERWLKEWAREF
ncbi:MAG: CoA-acylating methylmalonate-semialdehyde dehydrogenase [Chloroflexi bacterium]|jgi:malonate-semialdehyde dehydrogenase (acetylating) / methylmalonate-semialdehyde dehydrogenase|nr:CoA-acylating methylmalonate-semialdehyde dehydrogenase [Chloroflexota bacterium]